VREIRTLGVCDDKSRMAALLDRLTGQECAGFSAPAETWPHRSDTDPRRTPSQYVRVKVLTNHKCLLNVFTRRCHSEWHPGTWSISAGICRIATYLRPDNAYGPHDSSSPEL
jgi:hypothetical protein